MKNSSLRALASGRSATERAGRRSHSSRHSGICAFRSSSLREVRVPLPWFAPGSAATVEHRTSLRGALRHGSSAAAENGAMHSGRSVLLEQYERVPNLKYKDEDNTQLCTLEPLACAWCKWRSSRTELQFNQRANPSIKRTGLRPAAYVQR